MSNTTEYGSWKCPNCGVWNEQRTEQRAGDYVVTCYGDDKTMQPGCHHSFVMRKTVTVSHKIVIAIPKEE